MSNAVELHKGEAHAPATVADPGSLMGAITHAASDPNVNVDKLERLMSMYERIQANNARARYTAALAQMQPELEGIVKRGQNTSTRSRYMKWDDIIRQIGPTLGHHGFSLSFRTGQTANGMLPITGVLSHEAGHCEETTLSLPADTSGSKNAVQAVGSTVTYGKRYVAGILLNIAALDEEDDDGQAANRREPRGNAVISAEQAQELRDLVDQVGGDVRKLCAYFRVGSLAEIPANQFDRVKRSIEKKRGEANGSSPD